MEKNEWNSQFSLCDNLLQSNSGEFGKHHYIHFINLKIWRLISQNKPSTLRQCLSLADEAYFLYKFDEHSIPMITDYGADRGLQSIAVGAVYSVILGQTKDAFRYIDMLVNSLPKLSHFFSFMISAQQLALSLILLGDYHGALELFTELRAKEFCAPFSLFIKINNFLFECLRHECDAEKHNSTDEDEKLISNLEKIMSGSERIHAVPFDVSYRLIELFGIGYENVLAKIYLLNALKVMKTLSSGMLSVEEVEAYKVSIKQLCNTGLNYLRVYVDDDINDCITDGYITVRVQSLWCKARILHMLYQISNELDEKTEYKSKITRTLESVDNIISTFFYENDSLIELTNKYWKLVLVDQDQKLLLDYVICRYERLVQELNDMSYQSPLTVNIIQRVISHVNKRIANLYC